MSKVTKQISVSQRKLLLAFLSIALIASIASSSVVYVYAQGAALSTITISGGPYPGAPSYTIFTEGGTYYAKDANGAIAFSSTNASTVINSASAVIGTLTTGGKILLSAGLYTLSSSITIYPYQTLVGSGYNNTMLKLASGANCNVIQGATNEDASERLGVQISDLSIDGNKAANTAGNGTWFSGYRNSRFVNLRIDNCKESGFVQEGFSTSFQFYLNQIMSYGNDQNGIYLTGSNNVLNYVFGNTNTKSGIVLTGGYESELTHSQGESNGEYGILLINEHHDNLIAVSIGSNGLTGLSLKGTYGTTVFGGVISGNTGNGTEIISSVSTLSYSNRIYAVQLSSNTQRGYAEQNQGAGVPINNQLVSCIFDSNVAGAVSLLGTNTTFVNPIGYSIASTGQVIKIGSASGTTPITVTHGLGHTPDSIVTTPNSYDGTWISHAANETSTTFQIIHNRGSSGYIYWIAIYDPSLH